jgi:hypothetical protein
MSNTLLPALTLFNEVLLVKCFFAAGCWMKLDVGKMFQAVPSSGEKTGGLNPFGHLTSLWHIGVYFESPTNEPAVAAFVPQGGLSSS